MKTCSACGVEKPLEAYRDRCDTPGRKFGRCQECMRAKARERYASSAAQNREYARQWRAENPDRVREIEWRRRYGISIEQLVDLIVSQGGTCAVCRTGIVGAETVDGKEQVAFHVDHNHRTGEVRGVLCQHCNWMLGHAKDDPARLLAAADYLNRKVTKP